MSSRVMLTELEGSDHAMDIWNDNFSSHASMN